MPIPVDRQSFIDYCLRRLGWPVIKINIDEDQLADRVDDALQYWWDYHFDGTQKIYAAHQITAQDVSNQYLAIDPSIISIVRIFPLSDSQATINMFDLRYQLRLNELYDFTSASYINFTLTMQHLRTLELLFTGLTPIQFNRHMNQLYIDWDWGDEIAIGEYAIMEAFQKIDPNIWPDAYNDLWLKKYATQLIKKQWGENLLKYDQVALPGGVMLNGQKIYDEAIREINKLEDQVTTDFSLPLEFNTG